MPQQQTGTDIALPNYELYVREPVLVRYRSDGAIEDVVVSYDDREEDRMVAIGKVTMLPREDNVLFIMEGAASHVEVVAGDKVLWESEIVADPNEHDGTESLMKRTMARQTQAARDSGRLMLLEYFSLDDPRTAEQQKPQSVLRRLFRSS